MARLKRPASLTVALLSAAVTLSSCGTGGATTDARQACRSVHHSLVVSARSRTPDLRPAQRRALEGRALLLMLRATPAAAAATSLDGSWNPLVTTINEAERVPITYLVPALTRLCQIADSSTPYP